VVIGGATYAGIRLHSDAQGKDDLVKKAEQLATGHASAEQIAAELVKARADAQAEGERLNLFVNYPTSPEALAAVREEVYENIFETIDKLTIAVKVSLKQGVEAKLQEAIAAEKAHIQEVLKEWKELVTNPKANTDPTAAAKAAEYAAEIQTDIQDLKKIVDQLTPGTSGLTPAEIAAEKAAVEDAIEDIQQAVSDLGQPVVPPNVVQDQQQDVNNAQNNVNNLQQDLNDANNPNNQGNNTQDPTIPSPDNTTSPGDTTSPNSHSSGGEPAEPNYPGTRYEPPAPVQDPSKPKLIEGANMEQ
jgi:hypothetical protein